MSAIIEVMIGMVFVFSLLSILVTQINTVISNILNLRAKHLRSALDELLTDPVLRAKVFAHPLIRLIPETILPGQTISAQQAEKAAGGKLNPVSWVAPETFVSALLNVVKADSDQDLFGALLTVIDNMPADSDRRTLRLMINRIQTTGEGLTDLRAYIEQLDNEIYKETLTSALEQIDDEIGQLGMDPTGLISVIAGLRKVKNPFFRTAMETVLATSKNLDDAQQKLAAWFNDGMNRATESFSRHMQKYSLLVGLLIALVVNIDTLQVARTLWEDPILRSSVAEVASNTDLAPIIEQQQQNAAQAEATPDPNAETTIEDVQESVQAVGQTVQQITDLRLPIGWEFTNPNGYDTPPNDSQLQNHRNLWNYFPGNSPYWFQLLVGKMIGLLATMIAVSQGAPFWFNILNRLMGRG